MGREQPGQRTVLSFGGVTAEVALLKTSGKPREARHEVRWPDQPDPADLPEPMAPGPVEDEEVRERPGAIDSPMGGGWGGENPHVSPGPESQPEPEPVEPPKPQHGVTVGDEWVDLTERFAEIDERTRLEGMEVLACVPSASVPRERVRDAHWVASGDGGPSKVLALVWAALSRHGMVAAVCWTKRTNQALGVLVPRRVGRDAVLALLELEWAQNMREPSERVRSASRVLPTEGEVRAAERLVDAYRSGPGELDDLRDERLAKRVELLAAAREGRLGEYEPPQESVAPDEAGDLAALLLAAAEAR